MEKLYSFGWDFGYSEMKGLFIAKEDDVKKLFGKEIYFGEVLGKHSEVVAEMGEGDIEERIVSPSTLAELKSVFGDTICGFNPLDYV